MKFKPVSPKDLNSLQEVLIEFYEAARAVILQLVGINFIQEYCNQ